MIRVSILRHDVVHESYVIVDVVSARANSYYDPTLALSGMRLLDY